MGITFSSSSSSTPEENKQDVSPKDDDERPVRRRKAENSIIEEETDDTRPRKKIRQAEWERPARRREREEEAWEYRYQLLKDFKQQHGHTRVPRDHAVRGAKLGSWVRAQRQQARKRRRGIHSPLCPDRIEQLNVISFEWEPTKKKPEPKLWDSRYKALLEFKKTTWTCTYP